MTTTAPPRPTLALRPAPETRLVPWRRVEPVVRIRAIQPGDAAALERFYARLSPGSRASRFFGPTAGLSHGQSASFCQSDHRHREGFVAEIDQPGGGHAIVGHLCLEPDGPGIAEIAIAVADELQGQGLGRRLMEAGLNWAATERIARLSATMLEANPAIHRLLAGLGLPATFRSLGSGVAAVTIDLRGGSAAP